MEFRHNTEQSRFEAWDGDQLVGEAHYTLRGTVADFDHTYVLPQFGGRGIAGDLVRYAMDAVRASGTWTVKPTCSYVVTWFGRHPEDADLLAS